MIYCIIQVSKINCLIDVISEIYWIADDLISQKLNIRVKKLDIFY